MAPVKKPDRDRNPHFIAAWRKSLGLTQTAVEDELGWNQSKVSRLERGETPYDQDALERLAELFDRDVVDLLKSDPADPDALWRLFVRVSEAPKSVQEQAKVFLKFLLQGAG
jgi:transcriptional regulator with XRE-family HTH domain